MTKESAVKAIETETEINRIVEFVEQRELDNNADYPSSFYELDPATIELDLDSPELYPIYEYSYDVINSGIDEAFDGKADWDSEIIIEAQRRLYPIIGELVRYNLLARFETL